MADFVRLTSRFEGNSVFVNPRAVCSVIQIDYESPVDETHRVRYTVITMDGGHSGEVKEDAAAIVELLAADGGEVLCIG